MGDTWCSRVLTMFKDRIATVSLPAGKSLTDWLIDTVHYSCQLLQYRKPDIKLLKTVDVPVRKTLKALSDISDICLAAQ